MYSNVKKVKYKCIEKLMKVSLTLLIFFTITTESIHVTKPGTAKKI